MPNRFLKAAFFDETDPKRLAQLAKLAEKSGRSEDQCWFVTKMVKNKCRVKGTELTESESDLMLGFKDLIKAARSQRLDCIDELLDQKYNVSLLEKYKREIIEAEIYETTTQVIGLLQKYIMPGVRGKKDETEVTALKLIADYFRYLTELSDSQENIDRTLFYYQSGWDIAIHHLHEIHVSRLGLALNFSVFYMDICDDKRKACLITKYAIDTAKIRMDLMDQASLDRVMANEEIAAVFSLLNDQLRRWHTGDILEDSQREGYSEDLVTAEGEGEEGDGFAIARESGTR